jgi:hypothetical protein
MSSALLMFHEMFTTSILALLWLLVSVGGIAGMFRQHQWCRVGLGIFFFIGAAMGLYYLLWYAPSLDPTATPLLTRRLLPFWLSSFAIAYAAGGLVMLISTRIKRATARGFGLWDRTTY